MTGPEHYREAEARLLMAWEEGRDPVNMAHLVAEAQVHATLALAAATALTSHGAINYGDEPEIVAWREAAGVRDDGQCGCDHHGDHAGCRHDCECAR